MPRGEWSAAEASEMLEEWRRSGLPLQTFAKLRNLVPERLRRWKAKINKGAQRSVEAAPPLLPVRLADVPRRGEPVTVQLRTGHVLKVSRGFDEVAFARVVALLEGN